MSELNPSEAQRKRLAELLGIAVWELELLLEEVNSIPEGAPVGTIARRPDGALFAARIRGSNGLLRWTVIRADWSDRGVDTADDDADSWPQIRPDEWPVSKVYSTEEAAEILGVDLTAQQELTFPVVDPHGTVNMDGTPPGFTPKTRTPRVVDRLGVDEQGSRWRDRVGDEWWYTVLNRWRYRSHIDGVAGAGNP
ncbi:hypothetical protein BKG82_22980 [Mycobacteroides chelonae]|uniref:Uncharacterized protein n=1 Tax=Mycobacteroides chelonae TaxID=1774 RepID=A0A1S1LJE5_MYCCH|nr:hypothetical protein [Mycobacteroides chelonae]OHU51463.1 hypothetical protein BKG82_22980 [Mycobacteroides chelonae]